MNNDRLYIDDVLVDLGENVEITLVINSNLFRDISKITGNTTYTIRLPRTANNAAVFGVSGDVRSDDTFPTSYHKADYIRGGVPVITGGRAVLLSVSDMYEISISWGAFAPLADVVNKGLTLPQLTGNETIYFGYQNFATNYDNAMLTGYYYATYDPFINETSTEWVSADEPMWNQGQEAITFQSGAVLTGAVGETISLTPIARAGSQCAVVSFMAGMFVNLSGITGAADAAAWCVVDKANNVIIKSEELTAITEGFIAPVNALRLIVNTTSGGSGLMQYLALPTTEGDLRLDYINKFSRLPVVNVSWILARIEQDTGVTFDFPPTAKSYIDTLAIPLVTAKANALTMGGVAVMTINSTPNLGQLSIQAVANNIFDEQTGQVFQLTASREAKITIDTQGWFLFNVSAAVPIEDGSMDYDGVTVNTKTYGFFPTYIEIKVEHTDPQAEDEIYIVGTEDFNNFPTQSDWQSDNGVDFQRLIYGYGEINIVSGDEITFTLKNRIGKYRGFLFAGGRLIVSEKVDGDVPRGAQFPIIANLPDIKVTDFVQFLCAITGTIPLNLQRSGNVLFNGVNNISTATAYDWTTKVIPSHDNVEQAREITYRINEYARKNWYKWKADSTTLGNYDAYMEINDATLESEHDVITFPFAASDGNRVPIFEADNNGGTGYGVRQEVYKLKPCEPRIMSVYKAANGTAALRFDINMQNVIDTQMTGMAASLADVRVIKERVRMSDVELAAFNESVPVYLRQYGSYFAVLTLESSGDGTAIATMLRLRKSSAEPVPPPPPPPTPYVEWLKSIGCVTWLPLTEGNLEDKITETKLTLSGNGSMVWDANVGMYKFTPPSSSGQYVAKLSNGLSASQFTDNAFTTLCVFQKVTNNSQFYAEQPCLISSNTNTLAAISPVLYNGTARATSIPSGTHSFAKMIKADSRVFYFDGAVNGSYAGYAQHLPSNWVVSENGINLCYRYSSNAMTYYMADIYIFNKELSLETIRQIQGYDPLPDDVVR